MRLRTKDQEHAEARVLHARSTIDAAITQMTRLLDKVEDQTLAARDSLRSAKETLGEPNER